ncbi:MAG: GNAT family N-acetyltransferase [Burkholderiales bacterium]
MRGSFTVSALGAGVDRSTFLCGSEPLDRYFQTQVTQDIKRRVTACFVAGDASGKVVGYYTLASASVSLSDLPAEVTKRLPRYPSVPAVRMGRLAVDLSVKGSGLGAALLSDALRRASVAEIAAYALIVDAKDSAAASFYAHHGFIALPHQEMTLFLPLASVQKLL